MNAHMYDSDWDYREACGDDTHAIEARAEDLLGDIAWLIEQAPAESRSAFVAALDDLLARQELAEVRHG